MCGTSFSAARAATGVTIPQKPVAQRREAVLAQQVEVVRDMLAPSDSVQYANDRAASLVAQAKASVAGLPDTGCRKLMLDMADAVLTRQF